jgi:hypothetical protein
MGRYQRTLPLVMLALVTIAMIAAPADLYAARPTQPTAVAISDMQSVVGRWSGILYGRPGGQRGQDWVELAIHEDGTYTLASARTIGVFEGTGKARLQDGRLITEGEKGGRATFTLYQRGNKRFLRVDGSLASGQPLQADLYPAP